MQYYEFMDEINLLEECVNNYEKNFEHNNYVLIDHKGNKYKFNILNSKLPHLLGISDVFIKKVKSKGDKTTIYDGMKNLIRNKSIYDYRVKNGLLYFSEIFNGFAHQKLMGFKNLGELNCKNIKFIVEYDPCKDIYGSKIQADYIMFYSDKENSYEGSFLYFKRKDDFLIPVSFVACNDEITFKNKIDSQNINLVIKSGCYNKATDTQTRHQLNKSELINISNWLTTKYNVDCLHLSSFDFDQILFDNNNDYTLIKSSTLYTSSDVGGRLKLNKPALMVLEEQKNRILEFMKKSETNNEEIELLLYELYCAEQQISMLQEQVKHPFKTKIKSLFKKKI